MALRINIFSSMIKGNPYLSLSRTFTRTTDQLRAQCQTDDDLPVEMENPFKKERAQCILCRLNIQPDFKNTKLLSQFVSSFTGKTYGRYITGLCKKKQEQVVKEIMKAQSAGFMPYYNKDPAYLEDPKLFHPEKPIRPHDF